jgi:hypothetical protein
MFTNNNQRSFSRSPASASFACLLAFGSALLSGCSGEMGTEMEMEMIELGTVEQAISATNAQLTSASSTTSFSGHGTGDRTLSKSYTLNQAITGIHWQESTDDPCFLKAHFQNVASGAAGADLTHSGCAGHSMGNEKSVHLPDDFFVTKVQVCMDNGDDKIKGIEIKGQHIDCLLGASTYDAWESTPNGSQLVTYACAEKRDSAEHTNCNTWSSERSCPTDYVATGMKLELASGSGDRDMIEGIALICNLAVD